MDRWKRGLMFWVLLLVSVALPSSAQTTVKKIVYKAQITVGSTGKGAALVTQRPSGYDFLVRTHAYPDWSVTKVALLPDDGTWEVILCENGGMAGDCTYALDGNLDLEGTVVPSMISLAGISGATFAQTLRDGRMTIRLNDGVLGSGVFVRII